MGIKKLLEKIDKMELDNKIILFTLLVGIICGGVLYLAALLVPNFEPFINNTILYQAVGISIAIGVIFVVILVIIITIKTAIKNQVLFEQNKKLQENSSEKDAKIQELDTELQRLKRLQEHDK